MDSFCKTIPYALDSSSWEILYANTYKNSEDSIICCPYCREEVFFKGAHVRNKDGSERKKHFSHKRWAKCVNKVSSEWESLAHKQGKKYIRGLLESIISQDSSLECLKLQCEYPLKDEAKSIYRIADVYLEFKKAWKLYRQAYEIQYSNVPEEELSERHRDYVSLWVQDTWFVWLQFKSLNKKEESEDGFLLDYDVQEEYPKHFFRDDDLEGRTLLKRVDGDKKFSEKILPKTLSLYKKISSFQEYMYFLDAESLRVPKHLSFTFIWGESFHHLKERVVFVEDKRDYTGALPSCHPYFTVQLIPKREIVAPFYYDTNLLRLNKSDFSSVFLLERKSLVYDPQKDEEAYKERTVKRLQEVQKNIEYLKNLPEKINQNKNTDPHFAKIYFFRLLGHFLTNLNNSINTLKKSTRHSTGDSLQWINTTILAKKSGDSKSYGFFSAHNTVYDIYSHIVPRDFLLYTQDTLKYLEDINSFLESCEVNISELLCIETFQKDFGEILLEYYREKPFFYLDHENLLNSDECKHWIQRCLKNYCWKDVLRIGKGDINTFFFYSVFWKYSHSLKNNFLKEADVLRKMREDVRDCYGLEWV